MTYTSSLNTVHKQGLFGDYENKKENCYHLVGGFKNLSL